MTNLEFKQIMNNAEYEASADCSTYWKYKKENFGVREYPNLDEAVLQIPVYTGTSEPYGNWSYRFKNISKMNSIKFKKQLEGMTDYAYALCKDINRHIEAIPTKLETRAKRLGILDGEWM